MTETDSIYIDIIERDVSTGHRYQGTFFYSASLWMIVLDWTLLE